MREPVKANVKVTRKHGRVHGRVVVAQKRTPPDVLYHFTCSHGLEGIGKTGVIVPRPHPLMRGVGPLIWLTDLPNPTVDAVGLTSEFITCDRMQYRYAVRTRAATHWFDVRERVNATVVETMEQWSDPAHWWVVRRPLLSSEFVLDPTYQREETPS